jgi:hypothetical protein
VNVWPTPNGRGATGAIAVEAAATEVPLATVDALALAAAADAEAGISPVAVLDAFPPGRSRTYAKNTADARLAAILISRRHGGPGPRGLHFAPNGPVEVRYSVLDSNGAPVLLNRRTRWHLKEGDRTTPADAARLYWDTFKHPDVPYLVVLRCGPHPSADLVAVVRLPG